jgi:hypothetical protein
VDLRAGLDAVAKRTNPPVPCLIEFHSTVSDMKQANGPTLFRYATNICDSESSDSSVGTALGYGLDGVLGFDSRCRGGP